MNYQCFGVGRSNGRVQGLGTRAFAGTMMAAAGCRLLGGLRARMVRRSARSDHQSGRSGTGLKRRKGAEECSNC